MLTISASIPCGDGAQGVHRVDRAATGHIGGDLHGSAVHHVAQRAVGQNCARLRHDHEALLL